MAGVTVYGLSNCDTCRKARRWLAAEGVACDFIDYRAAPVDAATLHGWAAAAGGWEQLVNRRSTTWRQLADADKSATDDAAWLALVLAHPTLVKRPLLVAGGAVKVGFDAAAWQACLPEHT